MLTRAMLSRTGLQSRPSRPAHLSQQTLLLLQKPLSRRSLWQAAAAHMRSQVSQRLSWAQPADKRLAWRSRRQLRTAAQRCSSP